MAIHRIGTNVLVRETAGGEAEVEHIPSGNSVLVTGNGVSLDSPNTANIRIEPQDLSLVTGRADGLYLHNGTSAITLADGSTTTQRGYYIWDAVSAGWRQVAQDADTVDGFHADQLAKVAGDTFTGPVRISTSGQNALHELITAPASVYHPTQHLGGDPDNGIRTVYEPDTNTGKIGFMNAGAFTELLGMNQTSRLGTLNRMREINIGSFDADTYESTLRVYRNGALIGYIDQSGNNMRFKAFGATSSAMLINANNAGLEVTPNNRISFGGNDIGDMPKYTDPTLPPADTLFWDSTNSQLVYKDPTGVNRVLG